MFVQSTRECLICSAKFHQIDGSEERARLVTANALARHQAEAHREAHELWASICTCGMAEEERTGHYPEHADWCEVPSPLDAEETP